VVSSEQSRIIMASLLSARSLLIAGLVALAAWRLGQFVHATGEFRNLEDVVAREYCAGFELVPPPLPEP
jgi:hypothetical protein